MPTQLLVWGANLVALLVFSASAATTAGQVRVLCAVGMRQVMLDLGPRFERATGHTLAISFDASGVILTRLERGETTDVVMIPRSGIERLAQAGKVVSGSSHDLATSSIAVAVRTGARKPDISTTAAFTQALLAAPTITCPDPRLGGSSGVHLAKVFERLGVAAALSSRIVYADPPGPNAATPGSIVASGRAAMALHQIQELMATPGIEIVGPLPNDLQETFVFSAAIMSAARDMQAANELLEFLMTREARAVIEAKGMKTVAR